VAGAQGNGPGDDGAQARPLIDYPSLYTFKVMGRKESDFTEHVRALFRRVLGTEVPPDSIREQPSSKGTYVSVNVTVYLLSEEHRRSIYEQLHRDERVMLYF
jgi:uncharacterized protein